MMVDQELKEKVKLLRDEAIRKQSAQEQAIAAAKVAVNEMKKAQQSISEILENFPELQDKFPNLQNVVNFTISTNSVDAEELMQVVDDLLLNISSDVEEILNV